MSLQRIVCAFALLSQVPAILGRPTKRDDVASCLMNAQVPVDVKGSADWTQDGSAYNLRLPIQPVAIAIPTTTDHIAAAVLCGAQNGVPVSAKGGGHSYTSLGFGGEDGHLMLEMNRMFNVSLGADNVAKVQPGARLGHVATELYNQGGRALSHGTCPGVGAFGHALHGGYGMVSHMHGLAEDWIVGATVVTSNGTVMHCSASENEDLFWAIRGAGASFGIVAELEFDTFAAPTQVTYFDAQLNLNAQTAAQALLDIQAFGKTSPAELTLQTTMSKNGYTIGGAYLGDEASFRAVLQPLLDKISSAQMGSVQTVGWLDLVAHFAGTTEINPTSTSYSAHDNFYASSMAVPELSLAAFEAFVAYLSTSGLSSADSWFIQMDAHGGDNSAISQHTNADTAYAHRDKLLLFQLYDFVAADQQYPAGGLTFLTGFRESVTSLLADGSWGMYANYPDSQISSDQAPSLYWGSNLPRLQQIKAKYDPGNLFRNPQSIQPVA